MTRDQEIWELDLRGPINRRIEAAKKAGARGAGVTLLALSHPRKTRQVRTAEAVQPARILEDCEVTTTARTATVRA